MEANSFEYLIPCKFWGFPVCLLAMVTLMTFWAPDILSSSLFRVFWPHIVFLYAHRSSLVKYLRGTCYRFMEPSLWVALSSIILWLANSIFLSLPVLSAWSPQHEGSARQGLVSLSLGCSLETFSKQWAGAIVRLTLLSGSIALYYLISKVLKIIAFCILPIFRMFLDGRYFWFLLLHLG